MSTFKQRTRTGSWSTFEHRFKPHMGKEGSDVLVPLHALPKGIDAAHVWTVTDDDGRLFVNPGFRFVNRFAYIICNVPWSDDDERQPPYLYD